jgi:ABC-type glycerol-3-phosphate transport system substrate-binding protein
MITRPAERAGLTFEAGLVERMLDDTGSEPGALALLAFALAELYAAKTADGTLTQVAYDGFGGVKGAIGQRAEDAVHRLGVTLKTVGEVFQGLLEIGEGKAVTRRALWARLVKSGEAEKLVTAFINARLLVASRSEAGQAVVEVAHEALFTAWQRLCTWVDTHRKQLKAGQDLEKAAREWHDIGEPRSGLASGARLKHYRQAIDPSALASRFLRASRRRLWIFRTLKVSAATLVLAIVAWFLITFVTSVQIIRVVGNSYGGLRKDLEIFNSTVGSEWPWHRAELVDDWNTKDTNARFDIAMQVLRGDIEADVIELDGIWLPSFIDNNPPFLESLNKWYGTDFEDRFWKQSLEVARPVGTAPSVCRDQDGKDTQCLYAIPLYVDVGLLFYRSDLLPGLQSNPKPQQDCQCDKVEIPRIQLDNLLEQVRKAVKDYPHPGLEGLVFQSTEYEGLNCMFFELLALELAREGEPISTLAPDKIYTDNCETSPPTCPGYKALERMHSWIYSEKHVVPSSTLVFREEESRFLFTYGKAVLLRNWPYVLQQKWPEGNPVTKDKVGVVQLKDGKPILGGWYLGIPSRAKHKDDAWQLIKFLADRDSNDQDLMLNRPRIPADQEILKKVLKDKYEKKDEKNESCLCLFSKGIQSALEQAMVRPKLVGYPEASKDIAKALHKVLVNPNAGDSAMKEALKDAQEALNKAPDKFKKFMWCDLRFMDPPYDKTEKEIIDNFEIKFKSKIQECAVLIVRATSDSEKWTVAGFNDEGKFRTVVIDDPSHELSKELKKEPINKIRIVELALSSLGRTLPPRI